MWEFRDYGPCAFVTFIVKLHKEYNCGAIHPVYKHSLNEDQCSRYMLTQPDRFDVALLHLERPVFYQDNIIPICLPPPDIALTGKIGLVAGWGKTDNSFGKTGTNILHKVLVPIIKNDECIRWHEDKNILVQVPCNYHIKYSLPAGVKHFLACPIKNFSRSASR